MERGSRLARRAVGRLACASSERGNSPPPRAAAWRSEKPSISCKRGPPRSMRRRSRAPRRRRARSPPPGQWAEWVNATFTFNVSATKNRRAEPLRSGPCGRESPRTPPPGRRPPCRPPPGRSAIRREETGLAASSAAIVVGTVGLSAARNRATSAARLLQSRVVGFDGQGEARVGLGVFVAAIDRGLARQSGEFQQRIPHHRIGRLEHAPAAEGKQRIAGEDDLVLLEPIDDVARGVSGRLDDLGDESADAERSPSLRSASSESMRAASLAGPATRSLGKRARRPGTPWT